MSCITREVELPLEADEAWEAVTELEDWLVDDADLRLEPGEEGTLRLPDGEERRALVEEVAPREKLAFWWWADDTPATLVELTLVPAVGGTIVRVVESGWSPLMAANVAQSGLWTPLGDVRAAAVAALDRLGCVPA